MEHQKEHPLIDGLFSCLPAPGSEWALDARAKWLRAAASITGLMYQQPFDEPVGAKCEVYVLPKTGEDSALDEARLRVARSGGPSLAELQKRHDGWDAPEVSGKAVKMPTKALRDHERKAGIVEADGFTAISDLVELPDGTVAHKDDARA